MKRGLGKNGFELMFRLEQTGTGKDPNIYRLFFKQHSSAGERPPLELFFFNRGIGDSTNKSKPVTFNEISDIELWYFHKGFLQRKTLIFPFPLFQPRVAVRYD